MVKVKRTEEDGHLEKRWRFGYYETERALVIQGYEVVIDGLVTLSYGRWAEDHLNDLRANEVPIPDSVAEEARVLFSESILVLKTIFPSD